MCVGTRCVPSVATRVVAKIYRPFFCKTKALINKAVYWLLRVLSWTSSISISPGAAPHGRPTRTGVRRGYRYRGASHEQRRASREGRGQAYMAFSLREALFVSFSRPHFPLPPQTPPLPAFIHYVTLHAREVTRERTERGSPSGRGAAAARRSSSRPGAPAGPRPGAAD